MAGRLTYLFVLAILAALISVLNARTPGERVWAILMVLLVVVFMIPWLEEAGRMRRPQGVILVHLDSPWTIFYGLLVVVGVTNYLPTRYGMAAACLGLALILEYLGLTRADWPASRRAIVVGVGGVDVRRRACGSLAGAPTAHRRHRDSTGSGSGSATIGGSSGRCATRNGSIARPSWRGGRSG